MASLCLHTIGRQLMPIATYFAYACLTYCALLPQLISKIKYFFHMVPNLHSYLWQVYKSYIQELVSVISSEAAIPGWIHPAPLRTWKLSSRGPHQYWAGRLPGNVRCCLPFSFFLPSYQGDLYFPFCTYTVPIRSPKFIGFDKVPCYHSSKYCKKKLKSSTCHILSREPRTLTSLGRYYYYQSILYAQLGPATLYFVYGTSVI